jgi:hypothetical protein
MRLTNVVSALTNAVVSDASIGIRLVAARHLLSIDFDQAQVLDLLVTNSWSRGQTKPALRGFAIAIKNMISPELLKNKMREYAKSPFPQVRTCVAVGLPIWFPNSGLTRRILVELAADTNKSVAATAAMEVRQ